MIEYNWKGQGRYQFRKLVRKCEFVQCDCVTCWRSFDADSDLVSTFFLHQRILRRRHFVRAHVDGRSRRKVDRLSEFEQSIAICKMASEQVQFTVLFLL